MFLHRHNYLKVESNHPQVALQDGLFQFMVARRKLHKMYDLIHCEDYLSILNHFSSDKFLLLKDCYMTVEQVSAFATGSLNRRLSEMEEKLLEHLHSCPQCKLKKETCEVCHGGVPYFAYNIEIAG